MVNLLKKIRDVSYQEFLSLSTPSQTIIVMIGIGVFMISFGLLFKAL